MFPLPLAGPEELVVDRLEKAPDIEVTDHPIFSVFAGERNSFLSTVTVNRYFAADKNWLPEPDSSTRVIARLRNKAPLVVERQFGEGRVVALLTKASPVETTLGSWNNWARDNPSFVVAMLEMQSYLSAARHPDTTRLVGTPLAVPLDVAKYLPQVRFVMPRELGGSEPVGRCHWPNTPLPNGLSHRAEGHAAPRKRRRRVERRARGRADRYRHQRHLRSPADRRPTAREEVEHFAFNVAPEEGNLKQLDATPIGPPAGRRALRIPRGAGHQLQPATIGRLQSEREPVVPA